MSTTSTITPGELEDALRGLSREDMCRWDTADARFHWNGIHHHAPADMDPDGTIELFELHRQCADGLAVHHTNLRERSYTWDSQSLFVYMRSELETLIYAQRVSLATGTQGEYRESTTDFSADIVFTVRPGVLLWVTCPELTDTCLDLLSAGGVILHEGGDQA